MYEPIERPPIDTSHLSLILTVPPGRADTADALADWVGYLNGTELDYEILLTSEETGQCVDEFVVNYARVRALLPTERNGFGSALKVALEQARHPLVFYARCDRSYRPAEIQRLLQLIPKVDLAVGQRTYSGEHQSRPLREFLYRSFVRAIFALRLRDLGCLYVLARRSVFARIPIQSRGLFAHTEILAKSNFLGCLHTDAPVSYKPPMADTERVAWTDMRRVIAHPDFGPVQLPTESVPAAEPQASTEPQP
jgi:hypothetical protein